MERKWWKEAVVYQIWPRSFNDSNGDGIGDLKGIIKKLDYLKDLGIDIIWLSPIYKSPNDDNGYDISDYYDIMDEAGSMSDMNKLIDEVHKRGMKIIMDLVVNHTSDEHPWFVKSRTSKDNSYRDYYIWRKGKDNNPPNNWASIFGGSVWEYNNKTDEYYLHLFSKKQPDLNWDNPIVREEVYEIIKWWLDKGIDGFRMDAINMISKVKGLPDGEKKSNDKYGDGSPFYYNGPKVHEYLQEMNKKVLSKYDIMTAGETHKITLEEVKKYIAPENNELNMCFIFDLMYLDAKESKWEYNKWKLTDLKRIFNNWYTELMDKGWNALFMDNHDQPRMVSRYGNDSKYRVESAKMLATLMHTLPGTPYIYQGEEIGMTNVKFDSIDDYRDIETINLYSIMKKKNIAEDKIMESIYTFGRDNARTPMQWDDSENAGFTNGKSWIKCNTNYKMINVKRSLKNPDSIYHYYKKLIKLRKDNLIFIYGDYKSILNDNEQIYAYIRKLDDECLLVMLNFYESNTVFNLPDDIRYNKKKLLISNYKVDELQDINNINLKSYEARVYKLLI
jgi:oligo-1,6-glucosidase